MKYREHVVKTDKASCKIILGDCREVLQSIDNLVDLIITSPPYADARKRHYDSVRPNEYKKWFMTFHEPFYESLRPQGSFVLNIKGRVVNGTRHRYVWNTIESLTELGWRSIDDYIWHKTNPMPGYWPTRLRDGWEYCFHLSKITKPFINQDAVRIPIGDWAKTRLNNLKGKDLSRHDSENASGFGRDLRRWVGKKSVLPSNILSMALVGKNKGHPAVFPIDLPRFFIKLLSPENGIILDPFAGSGTTGIAAMLEGRDSILIENQEEYFDSMIERITSELELVIDS